MNRPIVALGLGKLGSVFYSYLFKKITHLFTPIVTRITNIDELCPSIDPEFILVCACERRFTIRALKSILKQ